jgi:hypothetical protein
VTPNSRQRRTAARTDGAPRSKNEAGITGNKARFAAVHEPDIGVLRLSVIRGMSRWLDDLGLRNGRDDRSRTATLLAFEHVNGETAPQELGPGQAALTNFGGYRRRGFALSLVTLLPRVRGLENHLGASLGMGGQEAMVLHDFVCDRLGGSSRVCEAAVRNDAYSMRRNPSGIWSVVLLESDRACGTRWLRDHTRSFHDLRPQERKHRGGAMRARAAARGGPKQLGHPRC